MHLETSYDSILFFQAGVLSILRLIVTRMDGLPGGVSGGIDMVKGGSLT